MKYCNGEFSFTSFKTQDFFLYLARDNRAIFTAHLWNYPLENLFFLLDS